MRAEPLRYEGTGGLKWMSHSWPCLFLGGDCSLGTGILCLGQDVVSPRPAPNSPYRGAGSYRIVQAGPGTCNPPALLLTASIAGVQKQPSPFSVTKAKPSEVFCTAHLMVHYSAWFYGGDDADSVICCEKLGGKPSVVDGGSLCTVTQQLLK